ncbi:fluoroquinolone transport system permease protein [Streptomyces canus]|uniref:ABC transporter n=1 Tax=Streptomyces canus TaxID=58343 RepID=UPI002785DFE4|nr:ABC transporter [Streptomyces canus]MDQ0600735.1 fluoroquinolone transport system permease protein [Streptomyces canus]
MSGAGEARVRSAAVWRVLPGPVLRTLPWRALGAAGGVGLLLAGAARWLIDGDEWLALNLLRATALAFALGLAFLLDDPARETTASVPTTRPLRQALRVAMVAPFLALAWTVAMLLVPGEIRPPVGDVTLEAAATSVLALAAAAVAVRFNEASEPGQAVAAAVLTSAVVLPLALPGRWAMFVAVRDERWAASHERWVWVLVGAAVVWAACGPERLRRRALRDGPSGA